MFIKERELSSGTIDYDDFVFHGFILNKIEKCVEKSKADILKSFNNCSECIRFFVINDVLNRLTESVKSNKQFSNEDYLKIKKKRREYWIKYKKLISSHIRERVGKLTSSDWSNLLEAWQKSNSITINTYYEENYEKQDFNIDLTKVGIIEPEKLSFKFFQLNRLNTIVYFKVSSGYWIFASNEDSLYFTSNDIDYITNAYERVNWLDFLKITLVNMETFSRWILSDVEKEFIPTFYLYNYLKYSNKTSWEKFVSNFKDMYYHTRFPIHSEFRIISSSTGKFLMYIQKLGSLDVLIPFQLDRLLLNFFINDRQNYTIRLIKDSVTNIMIDKKTNSFFNAFICSNLISYDGLILLILSSVKISPIPDAIIDEIKLALNKVGNSKGKLDNFLKHFNLSFEESFLSTLYWFYSYGIIDQEQLTFTFESEEYNKYLKKINQRISISKKSYDKFISTTKVLFKDLNHLTIKQDLDTQSLFLLDEILRKLIVHKLVNVFKQSAEQFGGSFDASNLILPNINELTKKIRSIDKKVIKTIKGKAKFLDIGTLKVMKKNLKKHFLLSCIVKEEIWRMDCKELLEKLDTLPKEDLSEFLFVRKALVNAFLKSLPFTELKKTLRDLSQQKTKDGGRLPNDLVVSKIKADISETHKKLLSRFEENHIELIKEIAKSWLEKENVQ